MTIAQRFTGSCTIGSTKPWRNLDCPQPTLLTQTADLPASMQKSPDPFENTEIKRLQLFLYLVPVVGFFPALWSLYYRSGTKQQQDLSRVVVTLTLGWLVAYLLLGVGAEASESLSVPLLVTSSLLTSGYFLVNIWLMVRLWQRKSVRLPVVSKVGDRLP